MYLRKVKIGQIIVVHPVPPEWKIRRGRVVRIHPLCRYYTVEFGEGNHKYRESFSCWDLTYNCIEIEKNSDDVPCFEREKLKNFLWVGQSPM